MCRRQAYWNVIIASLIAMGLAGGIAVAQTTESATPTVGGNWTDAAVWSCNFQFASCIPNNTPTVAFDVVANTYRGYGGVVLDSSSSPTTVTVDSFMTGLVSGCCDFGYNPIKILSGATLNVTGNVTTNLDRGLQLDGGTLNVGGNLTNSAWPGLQLDVSGPGGSVLNVGGDFANYGSLDLGTATGAIGGNLTKRGPLSTSGAVKVGGSFINEFDLLSVSDGGTFTVGSVSNHGQVEIQRGASLTVSASGSYTQLQASLPITAVFGTLTSPGGVNIDAGELFGDGTVNGSMTNSGKVIAGGYSPGKLTINGDYTQEPRGTLLIPIAGATNFNTLDVTGNATLSGTLEFVSEKGYVPLANTSFAFLDVGGSVSGDFTKVGFFGLNCPTCTFDLSTLTLNTGSMVPPGTVVPEPASLLLFGTGLLGLGWMVRRKTQTRVWSNRPGIP